MENMTQSELAEAMGIRQETISDYELGDRTLKRKLEFAALATCVLTRLPDILRREYEQLTFKSDQLNRLVRKIIGTSR